jgi:hypothetical protein
MVEKIPEIRPRREQFSGEEHLATPPASQSTFLQPPSKVNEWELKSTISIL